MEGLRDLYQEVILDHSKKPRNLREIENTAHHAKGHNPLCGDRVTVFVTLKDGAIQDVSFQGDGCAISTASASMMTEGLKGKTMDEAEVLFGKFHDLVTGKLPAGGGNRRPRQAGGFCGGSGVSHPRQVCDAGVAHTARRTREQSKSRVDGVKGVKK